MGRGAGGFFTYVLGGGEVREVSASRMGHEKKRRQRGAISSVRFLLGKGEKRLVGDR